MKISKNQILIPNDTDTDFCTDNKCTVIGWLQKIYLYPEDNEGYIPVNSTQHRKQYDKAISVLRKLSGSKTMLDLFSWECKTTPTKAASILNKIIKEINNEKQ